MSISTLPGSWDPLHNGYAATPSAAHSPFLAPHTAAARARRLLHEASMALALEKAMTSTVNQTLLPWLHRWFEAAAIPAWRRRPKPSLAVKYPLLTISQTPLAAPRDSKNDVLVVPSRNYSLLPQESASVRGELHEALLTREVARLEAEYEARIAHHAATRMDDARASAACARVRESILAGELRGMEARATSNTMAAAGLQRLMREVDEQRARLQATQRTLPPRRLRSPAYHARPVGC